MLDDLESLKRDMEKGVTDLTDDGHCIGCGQCCSSFLPVSDKEIDRIKRYAKKHRIKPQKIGLVYSDPVLDLTCPFLRKDVSRDRCSIYPVRPDICVRFRCDKPKNGEWYDGDLSDKKLVDMREIFGG